MSTTTLTPAPELQEWDVLPLLADAVVDSVEPRDERTVTVRFKEPIVTPFTQTTRDSILFFVTDMVHAVRGER